MPPDAVTKPKEPLPPSSVELLEENDGRPTLWDGASRWQANLRVEQKREGWYAFSLLVGSLVFLGAVSTGLVRILFDFMVGAEPGFVSYPEVHRYLLLAGGGFLGGTVFGAKWLYHAVAKGLWHQDRKLWRYLSPWISLGTTVGIGALIDAGLLSGIKVDTSAKVAASTLVGIGFLIGYLSDRALAKMKELAEVLFGGPQNR